MLNVIIAKKLNMSNRFDAEGKRIAVTLISAAPNVVAKIKSGDKDRYSAVQLGLGNEKKPTKQDLGNYKSLIGVPKVLREFRVENIDGLEVGQQIDVSAFEPGDVVKVSGISKGKGFAGAMKRHGFHGGPATHGQSDRARAPGSSGSGTTPGRVYKGKKMAGHMGVLKVTVPNLTVVETDKENNLLLLSGSVPGPRNGILLIEKVGHVEDYGSKAVDEVKELEESLADAQGKSEEPKEEQEVKTAKTEQAAENEKIVAAEGDQSEPKNTEKVESVVIQDAEVKSESVKKEQVDAKS